MADKNHTDEAREAQLKRQRDTNRAVYYRRKVEAEAARQARRDRVIDKLLHKPWGCTNGH